jgi:hemoglobin/transferrin/lactoferrin receptor protein
MSKFLIINLLIFLLTGLHGQTLSGIVRDSQLQPLSDTQLLLLPDSLVQFTKEDGRFVIADFQPGNKTIIASHLGFASDTIRVNPSTDNLEIILFATMLSTQTTAVVAERIVMPEKNLIAPYSRISGTAMAQTSPADAAEILADIPGVVIQQTSSAGGSPILRGFSASRNLLLYDGIRLNNAIFRLGHHQYLANFEPLFLEEIGVVLGPGSVIYGSDALGGVINAESAALVFANNGRHLHTSVNLQAASADSRLGALARVGVAAESWSFWFGFGRKEYGNLRNGATPANHVLSPDSLNALQRPTAYSAGSVALKAGVDVSAQEQLTFSTQFFYQDAAPRYDKYRYSNDYLWVYEPQDKRISYLRLNSDRQTRLSDRLTLTLSLQNQLEGRKTQKTQASDLVLERDEVETLGIQLWGAKSSGRFDWQYGADAYRDGVKSRQTITGIDGPGRFPNQSEYATVGVYANASMRLNHLLKFQAGLRWNYFSADFDLDIPGLPAAFNGSYQSRFSTVVASFGAAWQLSDQLQLRLGWRNGFRAPNFEDMAKFGESKGNTLEIPNTRLDPEWLNSFDFGLQAKVGRVDLRSNFFYARITGLIEKTPTRVNGSETFESNGQTYILRQKNNAGTGVLAGNETAFFLRIAPPLRLQQHFSLVIGNNISSGTPLDGMPPLTGKTALRYETEQMETIIYGKYALRQNRLSLDDVDDDRIPVDGTPAWFSLNLQVNTTFSHNISASIGVENMLDRLYRVHGSGINGPARNVFMNLTYVY